MGTCAYIVWVPSCWLSRVSRVRVIKWRKCSGNRGVGNDKTITHPPTGTVSPVMCALMYNTQHNAVKISLTNPGALTIWDLRKYLIRSHQRLAHRSICLEIPQMTHKFDSSSAVVHWPGPNEDLWNPVTPLFWKWLRQKCCSGAS